MITFDVLHPKIILAHTTCKCEPNLLHKVQWECSQLHRRVKETEKHAHEKLHTNIDFPNYIVKHVQAWMTTLTLPIPSVGRAWTIQTTKLALAEAGRGHQKTPIFGKENELVSFTKKKCLLGDKTALEIACISRVCGQRPPCKQAPPL
jgi:hypothetical protein